MKLIYLSKAKFLPQSIGLAAADALDTKNNSSNNGIHMKQSSVGGLLWTGCVQQLALVEMMSLLRVLPLHTLVATVRQVVKQPPIVEGSQQVRDPFLMLCVVYMRAPGP